MSEWAVLPSRQTRGEVNARILKTQYGNGYQQRVADGPNNTLQTWSLQFTNRSADYIGDLHFFLKTKAQTASSFTWTPLPPFNVTEGEIRVTCEKWGFMFEGVDVIGLQCELVQVAEP